MLMDGSLAHRWYAVQTTSGHEHKVQRLLQRKIDADAAAPEDRLIRQALVPVQEAVEIKNGRKVAVERKIYPGYVLVEMIASQDTLHEVNAIQGVIKFVGKEKAPPPPPPPAPAAAAPRRPAAAPAPSPSPRT